MALPKNRILLALFALIWIGGNLATVHWHLQSRSWFGWLVFAAILLSFGISIWDYYLNRDAYDAKSRRRAAWPATMSRGSAILMLLVCALVLLATGIYNIRIGNRAGGGIIIAFGLFFAIGLIPVGRRKS